MSMNLKVQCTSLSSKAKKNPCQALFAKSAIAQLLFTADLHHPYDLQLCDYGDFLILLYGIIRRHK